jgi:UMF1 family MFS transporter
MTEPLPSVTPRRGSRAEVLAWAMYDWANSAYSTILITVVLYYIQDAVFCDEQTGGNTGKIVWAWGIGASMLLAALLSPVVGAMADANASKRKWLAGTALPGASIAVLLFFVPLSWTAVVVTLWVLMCLLFELSLGFYNGFLPEIADERTMNRVSAFGFALGYLGGALALALAVVVYQFGDDLGLATREEKLKGGILVMGLWWGLFTLPALFVLRDRRSPPREKRPLPAATRQAIREVGNTLRNIRRYKMLALFLIAFLFYNDGIQTVISQAGTFAKQDLRFKPDELIGLILVIQLLALPGAMIVGYLADRLGQKTTLVGCLAIWIGLVGVAYFVTTKAQFWVLGVLLALVLGGTQSVSRAIMGMMTPQDRTAEFFGFFNFSGKATSFMGPFVFGLMIQLTGSSRQAIVALGIFFVIGLIVVAGVNVAKGRQRALEG